MKVNIIGYSSDEVFLGKTSNLIFHGVDNKGGSGLGDGTLAV